MATNDNIISLRPTKAQTPAQRAKAYRDRKRAAVTPAAPVQKTAPVTAVTPVTPAAVTSRTIRGGGIVRAPSRRPLAQLLLSVTAFGLAVVGIAMNGWFAHSLGSSVIAGWLFAAIGVAADLVALAIPSCAAVQWQARQRGTAVAGWLVWAMTFVFAATAGIGFASVNITDVTASRASRITPAIETARASLTDAMTSRDRECVGGVGKNCRAREEMVIDRRRALDTAQLTVEQAADPQTQAASRIVAWVLFGLLKPSADDFAMLRLILLALLPQLGGILLMIGRRAE